MTTQEICTAIDNLFGNADDDHATALANLETVIRHADQYAVILEDELVAA